MLLKIHFSFFLRTETLFRKPILMMEYINRKSFVTEKFNLDVKLNEIYFLPCHNIKEEKKTDL